MFWDINTQCDHIIKARKLSIIVVYKAEKSCRIDDIAIPRGEKVTDWKSGQVEKLDKFKK